MSYRAEPGVRLKDLPKWKAAQDAKRSRRERYIVENRETGTQVRFSTPQEVSIFMWGRSYDEQNIYQLQTGLPGWSIMALEDCLTAREKLQEGLHGCRSR